MIETYTVVGYWADTNERYKTEFDARTVIAAENMMLTRANDEEGDFRIAGTLLGVHDTADLYTAFVNPDDPANEGDCRVQYVSEEDEITEFTVVGIVLATDRFSRTWNEETQGERYIGVELATHPRWAEDMARAKVAERGDFELKVCAVFRGRKSRCESFPFSDHSRQAQSRGAVLR